MVNFTKLLGGNPSVSETIKSGENRQDVPYFQSCDISHPLVIFNITKRCNLKCSHCYLESQDKQYKGELSWSKIKKIIDIFGKIKIPVLLLSGGEPLMHKDIFKIIDYAKNKSIRVGLSTNGTLISKSIARRLKDIGIDYVGVSIDGRRQIHDKIRNLDGAYDAALTGLINSLEKGLKTGIRFMINKINVSELPEILDLCVQEKIPRFCMYHLVYAGRGRALIDEDIDNPTRRKIVDFLIKRTLELKRQKQDIEILTVDNHADGIYIYNYLKQNNQAGQEKALELIKLHGGCSAGTKVVDISPEGNISACQFWWDHILGNISKQDFNTIWMNEKDNMLRQLRSKAASLKGKCGRCRFKSYCGGCRIRAAQTYNDFFQEDPCCYLTENEIK